MNRNKNTNNKIKHNFIIVAFITIITFLMLFFSFQLSASNSKQNKVATVSQKQTLAADAVVQPLQMEHRSIQPSIMTKNGPIVYNGNTFRLLDWFGQPIWEVDLEAELVKRGLTITRGVRNNSDVFGVNKVFANFSYNDKNNMLYILGLATHRQMTYSAVRNAYTKQYIIPLNVDDGSLPPVSETSSIKYIDVADKMVSNGGFSAQYSKISVLGDGNVSIYSLNGTSGAANGGHEMYIYNPYTNDLSKKNILDIRYLFSGGHQWLFGINVYYSNILNVVPINENRNLVFLRQTRNTEGKGVGSIYTVLADANLMPVDNKHTSAFTKPESIQYQIAQNVGWSRERVIQEREFHGYNPNYNVNPITGVITFTIYDYIYFLTPTTENDRGYTFKRYQLPQIIDTGVDNGRVYENRGIFYSGYYDLLGDLYFNMAYWKDNAHWYVEPTVYRLRLQNNIPSVSTYVSLKNSGISTIDNAIGKFKIFAIPGQVGKIFLINIQTGISVAITQDPANMNIGKILGTLNGDSAFVVRPGFKLKKNGYFLIPSELESKHFEPNGPNDILSNFNVQAINDNTGDITVRAAIKYLPWFENSSSINFRTLEESKSFTGLKTINKIASWAPKLSSNLQNSITKQLTKEVITKEKPFVINANLKNTDLSDANDGYSIISTNALAGEITLGYKINYFPNLNRNGPKQTFSAAEKTYRVAKDDPASEYKLSFHGGRALVKNVDNGKTETTDIKTFGSLLQFKIQDMLPSDIAANSQRYFKSFIDIANTNGYPLLSLTGTITGDDEKGEVEVTINIPREINAVLKFGNNPSSIKAKFNGFNKPDTYRFDLTKFNSKETNFASYLVDVKNLTKAGQAFKYGAKLASQVSTTEIIEELLNIVGYARDIAYNIDISPNDIDGTLKLDIRLAPSYQKIKKGTLFDVALNNRINITVKGFKTLESVSEEANLITFLEENNPILLKMSERIPSSIATSEAFRLFTLSNKNTFGSLSEKNITLFANDVSGTLSILIDLSIGINNFQNVGTNGVKLPKQFLKTYAGFSNLKSGDYVLRPLQNNQLASGLDIKNLTAQQIFDNQQSYNLLIKGYRLSDASQISVVKNEFLKAIFVSYDFTNQSDLPNGIVKKFSVVYKYS